MAIFTGFVVMDIIGIIIALVAVIYVYFQMIYQIWKRKNIPYFKPTFSLGREPLGRALGDVFNVAQKARHQGWRYFGMFLGGRPFFVPLDLEMIKNIMTKDFNHFTDRGVYFNERDEPITANLFAIGGVKWRNLRTKLTPTFTSGKMKGMFQTLVDCGSLLEKSLKQYESGEPVDIKYVLACFSTDIIGSCAFGIDCNSFNEPDSPFIKYSKKLTNRTFYQQLKTIFAISFPNLARALHVTVISTDVSTFFFDVVKKTVDYREKNNYTRNDFLQLLINLKNNKEDEPGDTAGDGTTLNMNEMVAQCFLFFFAGFETSSTTMTFVLFELSQHQEIQEKVREELIRVLKKYDNRMCYDLLIELEYMGQVIEETLRIYPPVPSITRQCVADYKIPNTEVTLDKGTNILIPVKAVHYDETIYENPERFDPERFSTENKQKRHQYAHIPFGEGPRMCIGMRFGLMQVKVGLVTVLKNFRVKLNPKTKTPLEMDLKSPLPTTKGGMWLDLEKI